jgi:signal recognition particle subunit SRP68
MMAERAWSFAMQLRQESNTEPRKKFHLIGRLRKATTYALQLEQLCQVNYQIIFL